MKEIKIFKDEWLNKELEKGNIELKDLGFVSKILNLKDVENSKTWRNKFSTKLKKEGFFYYYNGDAYYSPKIIYEWSHKKWQDAKVRVWKAAKNA